ncbi:MAG: fasciclin domain-containing protein [Planctomycetota bacterium]
MIAPIALCFSILLPGSASASLSSQTTAPVSPQATTVAAPAAQITPTPLVTAPAVGTPLPGNIVEVATNNGNFTTLVAALQATGLDSALDGSLGARRLTVFAPTDAAFAALPPGTVQALLNDLPTLSSILLYHVTNSGLLANDVLARETIDTLNGQRVDVSLQNGIPFLDQAEIEITNIVCTNGVIHVIDAVLQPNLDNLVETAVTAPLARYLTHLLGFLPPLVQTLEDGEFTVFAPENAAFQQIPAAGLRGLTSPIGLPILQSILEVHVVPGRLFADEIIAAGQLTTVGGKILQVTVNNGDVFVDGARVIIPDIETANGNIHFIDRVLNP